MLTLDSLPMRATTDLPLLQERMCTLKMEDRVECSLIILIDRGATGAASCRNPRLSVGNCAIGAIASTLRSAVGRVIACMDNVNAEMGELVNIYVYGLLVANPTSVPLAA